MNRLATVRDLQQRITQMQPARLHTRTLPTRAELGPLLPDGALAQGAAVSVQGSLRLALALISEASRAGAWSGAIGIPSIGIEAAQHLGIVLDRFVLVPTPGDRLLGLTGTLSEVLSVMLIASTAHASANQVERVHAKLRDNGAALVVLGPWPRAACALRVTESTWSGLSPGQGMLEAQRIRVQSEDRRGRLQHQLRLRTDGIELESPHSAPPRSADWPRPLAVSR